MKRFGWVALVLGSVSACSSSEDPAGRGRGPGRFPDPEPDGVVDRVDLRVELGRDDVAPIGVARAGERTFVFDDALGLRELGGGLRMTSLPDPGVDVRLPFTDIAWIDGDEFTVTAIGDGFVLDTAAQTLQRRFCYEPGGPGDPQWDLLEQRTDAVAVAAGAGLIYAQPQTYVQDTGERTASSIASYDRLTGGVLEWFELDPAFTAGGMVVIRGGLLLGSGARLHVYDLASHALSERIDLTRFGVGDVSGLALDDESLFVVDAAGDQLLELDRTTLGI